MKTLSVKIPGEFCDSFIYSGVLFLVDFNSKLTILNWESLLNNRMLKEKEHTRGNYENLFFSGKERILRNHSNIDSLIIENIKESIISEIELQGWVTNIDIFSNKIYISSELGVSLLNFDGKKRFKKECFENIKEHLIFNDCKVFNFAINNYRALFCSGGEGAIYSLLDKNGKIEKNIGGNQDDEWIDCDWHSNENSLKTTLEINSLINKNIQEFKDASENLKRINNIKRKIHQREQKNKKQYQEERAYSLRKEQTIETLKEKKLEIEKCIRDDFEKNYNNYCSKETMDSYIKMRKSPIGCFSEKNNCIEVVFSRLEEKKIFSAINEIVSWRIFPRAKTHRNQLHIINNDCIEIIGFELQK